MAAEVRSNASQWMYFIGVLLVLIGVFGLLRIVHISVRSVPYPSRGVFPSTIFTPSSLILTNPRESECDPQIAPRFETDNTTLRQSSEVEKSMAQERYERCVNGFDEDRAKQKQYDRNQAALFVFVGVGLILSRRFLE